MAVICNVRHSSDKFWKKGLEYTVEASELTEGGKTPMFGRIYDDAMDSGFLVVSTRTGKEAAFYIDRTQRDGEREVQCWILKPTPETARKIPEAANIVITVFND